MPKTTGRHYRQSISERALRANIPVRSSFGIEWVEISTVFTLVFSYVFVAGLLGFVLPDFQLNVVDAGIYTFYYSAIIMLSRLGRVDGSYYTVGQAVFLAICVALGLTVSYELGGDVHFPMVAYTAGFLVLSGFVVQLRHMQFDWGCDKTTRHFFYDVEVAVKRFFDAVVGFLLTALISPLLLLVSLGIVLYDGFPVYYRQKRLGKDCRPIKILKFRSMRQQKGQQDVLCVSEPTVSKALFKEEEDPRVTSLGRLLRKTSIDELPQLINVLKGDMSLVGPRPFIPSEFEETNRAGLRGRVCPGMTGLWQITGRVHGVRDFDKVEAIDNHYIETWCLALDVVILLKTIPVVLFGKGAC